MDLERLLGKETEALTVGRSFGPAIERNGTMIVPVAFVAGGGGGGGDEGGEQGRPGGSGGGFGGVAWPLGVYVVADGDVRFVPALDVTRIALAGLALARLVVRRAGRRRAHAA